MSRVPVVVDCDPGHDDVVAMLVAAHLCELVAVTTVSGNASLADCTHNALAVAELFALTAPVHAGCERPLVQEAFHAAAFHGEHGLGGSTLTVSSRSEAEGHAVEVLIESTRAREGLWLVPTGPLTNIGLAIRLEPALVGRVAGISLMGGGIRIGNVTATAEFNIWCDPEAASVVFGCGAPLRMCALDVTHQVRVGAGEAGRIRALGGRRAAFLADVITFFAERYGEHSGLSAGPMHDPLAVLAVARPELFDFVERNVQVELCGGQRGMTVVDQRDLTAPQKPNCLVAEGVDAAALSDVIVETLEIACGGSSAADRCDRF
jgi:inosine-uridine nucleoside N-ribohydrolase